MKALEDLRSLDLPSPPSALTVLMRHKAAAAAAAGLVLLLCVGFLASVSPRYRAESIILLDPRKTNITNLPSVLSLPVVSADPALVRTEIQVLQDDHLAREIVVKLGLAKLPEFASSAPPLVAKIRDWAERRESHATSAVAEQSGADDAEGTGTAAASDVAVGKAVTIYKRKLAVYNDGNSYAIHLAFTSTSPTLAARIVNAHAQAYLAEQSSARIAASHRAHLWLVDEIERLRANMQAAEDAVQRFRQSTSVFLTRDGSIPEQQLSQVNGQLTDANVALANQEARLQKLKQAISNPDDADAVAEVLASPLIRKLREQQASLTKQQAAQETTLGPSHPALIATRAQLKNTRRAIEDEIQRIVGSARTDLDQAQTRVAEIRKTMSELQQKSLVAAQEESKLQELQSEVKATRDVYESLLSRATQTGAEEQLSLADARLISGALAPIEPSFPKPLIFTPIALVVSLGVGFGWAIVLERSQRGCRSLSEIAATCGVQALGLVPRLPSNAIPAARQPRSAYWEHIRTVRDRIAGCRRVAPIVLVVTSPLPGEGKTSFALSLTRSLADAGANALLLDCDLRRPGLSALLADRKDQPDVVEALLDPECLAAAIQQDQHSDADYIPARTLIDAPQNLLGSINLDSLIAMAKRRYDVVIIDSPPLAAASDATLLSRLADEVVLIVRWARTPRPLIRSAVATLLASGANSIGAVLSFADLSNAANFPACDYAHYSRRVRAYYADQRAVARQLPDHTPPQ